MADLVFVMGTSLTVHPFASLAGLPSDYCPRVLINLDLVGDFGDRPDDVILLGKCDETVKELCKELGWEEELNKLWEDTASSVTGISGSALGEDKDKDKHHADVEVDKLAEKMAATIVLKDVTETIQEKHKSDESAGKEDDEGKNDETKTESQGEVESVIQGEELPEQTTGPSTDAGKL